MINFKFFACEPRVYYPLRNPYYIDILSESIAKQLVL